MNPAREHSSHDDGLPADLSRAQFDLAAYIRERVSPDAVLLKIMQAGDESHHPGQGSAADVSRSAPDATRAMTIIRLRVLNRYLDHALDHARALDDALDSVRNHADQINRALDSALDLACSVALGRQEIIDRPDFASALDRALDRADARARAFGIAGDMSVSRIVLGRSRFIDRALANAQFLARDREIAARLGHALDLKSDLDHALNRALNHDRGTDFAAAIGHVALAHEHQTDSRRASELAVALNHVCNDARDLERDLERAHDEAARLAHDLERSSQTAKSLVLRLEAAGEVDVSGADLSNEDLGDMEALGGVIWTWATEWPPGVAGELITRSQEIREGVYQVHGTEGRDRATQIG